MKRDLTDMLGMRFGVLTILICLLGNLKGYAQIGGVGTFDFLNLPSTSRQLALGGVNVTSAGVDMDMFWANPALQNEDMDRQVALNYYSYYADIGQTSLSYGQQAGKSGFWRAGMQYIGYGSMDAYDETGASLGTFQVKDFAFIVSNAHKVGPFSLGTNLKFAYSGIGDYQSTGLFMDMGGAFIHPDKDLVIGMVFKNIGFPFSEFSSTQQFRMPFDSQIGISFKPEQMPVRLSVTYHHLHEFDIAYDDPSQDGQIDAFGNEINEDVSFADKLSRHFVLGGEFVLGKVVNLRFGYNFLRRREMVLEGQGGLAGASMGAMLNVRKFRFSYTRAWHHVAGGVNSFSLIADTRSLFTRKKKVID
ncbi:type IX secretion system protein PorQ [Limibacter armeniacum]|uniref:type IX secretion system protein PorQ n=1 Tax=Limibacter armeniacum TaxID=466084 RepID=UPI002FE584EB